MFTFRYISLTVSRLSSCNMGAKRPFSMSVRARSGRISVRTGAKRPYFRPYGREAAAYPYGREAAVFPSVRARSGRISVRARSGRISVLRQRNARPERKTEAISRAHPEISWVGCVGRQRLQRPPNPKHRGRVATEAGNPHCTSEAAPARRDFLPLAEPLLPRAQEHRRRRRRGERARGKRGGSGAKKTESASGVATNDNRNR